MAEQPKQYSILDHAQAFSKQLGWLGWLGVGLLVALYWDTAQHIWAAWTKTNGYYSHGPLVPLVTAWMIATHRDDLARLPRRPSWWGLLVLLLAGLIFLVSTLCHMYPPKYFAFVMYVAAMILLLWGAATMRRLLVPWLFLFFMVPLPDAVIDLFTYRLRLLVTASAVALTEPLNWYVVKSGNYVFFPSGDSLVVDDICAGLRSLISLLALGAVFAYLSPLNKLGRLMVFVLSGPIAIITNIVRIFALIVIAYFWGSQMASGVIHDVSGYAIFVVAFLMLYLVYRFLLLFMTKKQTGNAALPPDSSSPSRRWLPEKVGVGVLGATLVLNMLVPQPGEYQPQSGRVASLIPSQLGTWRQVAELPVDEETARILGTSDIIYRVYRSSESNHEVLLALVFSSGHRHSMHPPEVCYQAQGYTLISRNRYPAAPDRMTTQLHLVGSNHEELVNYWFFSQGRETESYSRHQIHLVINQVLFQQQPSVLIRCSAGVNKGNLDEAQAVLSSFVQSALPILRERLVVE